MAASVNRARGGSERFVDRSTAAPSALLISWLSRMEQTRLRGAHTLPIVSEPRRSRSR